MNFDVTRLCEISQSYKYIFKDFHYLNTSQNKKYKAVWKNSVSKKGSMVASSGHSNEKFIVTGFQYRGDETVLEIGVDHNQ